MYIFKLHISIFFPNLIIIAMKDTELITYSKTICLYLASFLKWWF